MHASETATRVLSLSLSPSACTHRDNLLNPIAVNNKGHRSSAKSRPLCALPCTRDGGTPASMADRETMERLNSLEGRLCAHVCDILHTCTPAKASSVVFLVWRFWMSSRLRTARSFGAPYAKSSSTEVAFLPFIDLTESVSL